MFRQVFEVTFFQAEESQQGLDMPRLEWRRRRRRGEEERCRSAALLKGIQHRSYAFVDERDGPEWHCDKSSAHCVL
jgi:hypothetical protein